MVDVIGPVLCLYILMQMGKPELLEAMPRFLFTVIVIQMVL